jgi:hypothetical protein
VIAKRAQRVAFQTETSVREINVKKAGNAGSELYFILKQRGRRGVRFRVLYRVAVKKQR